MKRDGAGAGGGMTPDDSPTLDDFLDDSAIAALETPVARRGPRVAGQRLHERGLLRARAAPPLPADLDRRRLRRGRAGARRRRPGDRWPECLSSSCATASGTVRAFHNVCRHRATIVLTEPCHGLKQLRCPYHAWTYGLDGALLATPFWDGTAKSERQPVDAGANGLVPVRCGVWNHVIFVNLAENAPPLEEYVAPMEAEFSHLDMDGLACGYRTSWEFNANWKLVMDNWEVYHHVWVHEGIFERMSDEVDLETGEPYTYTVVDGAVMTLRATARRPERGVDTAADGSSLPRLPSLAGVEQKHGVANAILPNTTLTLGPCAYVPGIYVPVAPGVTRAEMAWYFAPEAAAGPGARGGARRVARSLDRTRPLHERPARAPPPGPSLHGAPAGRPRLAGGRRREVLTSVGGGRALLPDLAGGSAPLRETPRGRAKCRCPCSHRSDRTTTCR